MAPATSVRLLYFLLATVSLVACATIVLLVGADVVCSYYATKLRSGLFAGFLTTSSFLFALHTFVVLKLKESVYDSNTYRQLHAARAAKGRAEADVYAPLRRLSGFMFTTAAASLLTALAQLTLGLIDHWLTAAACLGLAVFVFELLVATLFVLKLNTEAWLNSLN